MNADIAAKLESLKAQLKRFNAEIKEVSDEMIDAGFTKIPVFVAHQENAQIGELLFDRLEFNVPYSINATTVERLIELDIIKEDKIVDFKKAAGDTRKQYCVLWLSGPYSNFIFVPFKKT
jgi:hypothetical protein